MWKTNNVSHISTPPAATTDKCRTRRYTNNPPGTKNRSGQGELRPVEEPKITFEYPWWGGPLLPLAIRGGLLGAGLKALEQSQLQRKNLSVKDFLRKFVPSGVLGALLSFFFGATFLRTDFQAALLESASSPLVSIYWGIFGGYLGLSLWCEVLYKRRRSQRANRQLRTSPCRTIRSCTPENEVGRRGPPERPVQ
jgi:hypothetical protein